MLGGVPHQGGLPGQPVRVTRVGGVSFLHVKAAEWSNPPNLGNQITAPKPAKTHDRTTWLPTATSVASYFDDFTFKTATDEIYSASDNVSVESEGLSAE